MTKQPQNLVTTELIEEVVATGSAFVPDALGVRYIDAMRQDTDRIAWIPQASHVDPWLHYEDAKVTREDPLPAINSLRHALEIKIRSLGHIWPSLDAYRANDVTAQFYRSEHDGIDTHQDYSLDRLLIAVFTVRGHGPFEIMSARHGGKVLRSYETIPGSLILLWAPDLVPTAIDRRPPHRVLQPKDSRISVTYRYAIGSSRFANEWRA
jgi:hypothetical protein